MFLGPVGQGTDLHQVKLFVPSNDRGRGSVRTLIPANGARPSVSAECCPFKHLDLAIKAASIGVRDVQGTAVQCFVFGNRQLRLEQIDNQSNFETFFDQAPQIHPNASKITGLICGYRVEEIEDKVVQQTRYLDKLIDELAKGKSMEKILRK